MTSVQIKNVPPDVHRVLRDRAGRAGQSLQEYLLGQLEEQASRPTIKELFERIGKEGGSARLPLDFATRVVREERDAHSR